jgi:hypothetical protein
VDLKRWLNDVQDYIEEGGLCSCLANALWLKESKRT